MRIPVVLFFFYSLVFVSLAQPGDIYEPGMLLTLELLSDDRLLSDAELKKVTVWLGKPENRLFPQVKEGKLQIGVGNRTRPGFVAAEEEPFPRVLHLQFNNFETEIDFQKGFAQSLTYIIDFKKKKQELDVVRFKNTYRFSKIDNQWIHDTTGVNFSIALKNEEGKLTSVKQYWTTFTHHDRADSYGMQFWVEGFVQCTRNQTYDGYNGPLLDVVLTDGMALRHMEVGQVWGRSSGPKTMHESLNFEAWRFTILPTQSDLYREITPPFSFHNVSRAAAGLPVLKVHLFPKYSIQEGKTLELTLYEYFIPCERKELKGFWKVTEEGGRKYLDLMLDQEQDQNKTNCPPVSPVCMPYTFQLTLPKGNYNLRFMNGTIPKVYPDFVELKANSLGPVRLEIY